jgi:hypothetical protein
MSQINPNYVDGLELRVKELSAQLRILAENVRAAYVAGYSSGYASRSLNRSFSPEWHASGYIHDLNKSSK